MTTDTDRTLKYFLNMCSELALDPEAACNPELKTICGALTTYEKLLSGEVVVVPTKKICDRALEAVEKIETAYVEAIKDLNFKDGLARIDAVSENFKTLRAALKDQEELIKKTSEHLHQRGLIAGGIKRHGGFSAPAPAPGSPPASMMSNVQEGNIKHRCILHDQILYIIERHLGREFILEHNLPSRQMAHEIMENVDIYHAGVFLTRD